MNSADFTIRYSVFSKRQLPDIFDLEAEDGSVRWTANAQQSGPELVDLTSFNPTEQENPSKIAAKDRMISFSRSRKTGESGQHRGRSTSQPNR